ncbi:MAG: S9 family peptidase, partial [Bacteroidetes bacterium]|nr:S9 family peptidase [Bacteroidota bacterium]
MSYRLLFICFLIIGTSLGQKRITVSDIYVDFRFIPKTVKGVNWMNDGRYYTAIENNDLVKYDVTIGERVETLIRGAELDPSINFSAYSFSSDEKKILFQTNRESIYRRSFKADYFVYDTESKKLVKLSEGGKQSYATFSPDATKVGFVRDNNLFYVDLNDMSEIAITDDGEFNNIINGSTDWVYEEELYITKAFFWSPDGQKIAYYKFDESEVKEYNMQVWNMGQLYPTDYRFKFPKAGESNSKVSIHVYHLGNKEKRTMDLGEAQDIYVPNIQWTQNPNLLSIIKLNRLQNELTIIHADAQSGVSTIILTERSNEYIPVTDDENHLIKKLIYLEDGKHFLIPSDRDGYNHLYLYTVEGKLVRQITQGNWDMTRFVGIDEEIGLVYFISAEESPLERYFYSINLKGKKKVKLSAEKGVNNVNMSKDFAYYINYQSNADQPLNVSLFETKKNTLIKVLEDNKEFTDLVGDYGMSKKEFFTFTTEQGVELNGYMLKPTDFDSQKKYPVLMFQYSGPGSQEVNNSWGGGHYYWHQILTQKGYIVACIDGRGTVGRGVKFKKQTYAQLGKLETEDQIQGAKYLASLDYIDPQRVGIWGWSYGGYISALCMFIGAPYFKTGISVDPVT